MHPVLAASFSGMFEGAICVLLHAVFVLAALIYLIRVCLSPPQAGMRGLPRWIAVSVVLCVLSVCWAVSANDRGDDVSIQFAHYFPVAPSVFVLCLAATALSTKIKRQNKP